MFRAERLQHINPEDVATTELAFKLIDRRAYQRKLHRLPQLVDLKDSDTYRIKTPLPVACFRCMSYNQPALHKQVNQKQPKTIRLQKGNTP